MNKSIAWMLLPLLAAVTVLYYFKNDFVQKEPAEENGYDYFFAQRSFPYGRIDYNAQRKGLADFKNQIALSKNAGAGVWQYAGPNNIGGRITDIEMDPTDMNVAFLSAASGGIFKTTDGGVNWFPVFDSEATMSIGDLAIAPSNSNIIYAGTGEANGGSGSLTYDANGVYKSIDGGSTWINLGLNNTRMIGKVCVHPTNPDIAFVAAMGEMYGTSTDRGIYKTTDGGTSWQKVLYLNDSTGAIDVTINPSNPNIVFAAMWERTRRVDDKHYAGASSGLYKSTDGGNTWTQLTNANGLFAAGTSLSRICVDVCNAQPNVVYAKFIDDNLMMAGIYKSTDSGNNWTACNISSIPQSGGSGEYWFGKIKVDPTDPNTVYQIGFEMYKSTDGGSSWFNVFPGAHVDHHSIAIHPLDNGFVMNGNDGGLYISSDGGLSSVHNEDLPITQFYAVEMDNTVPSNLYGGTQDNNCIRTTTGSLYDWSAMIGGDGFYCLVDPTDNNNLYCEYQYGGIYSSNDGGINWNYAAFGINGTANWNCPIVFDPQNPWTLFTGAQQVFRSDDGAMSWYSISPDLTTAYPNGGNLLYGTISTIDVSTVNSNVIYAGTDDGKIWVTTTGGNSWNDVTGSLPKRYVTHVTCDPFMQSRAYVTMSGYRYNDNAKHVYMTSNYGTTWADISGNLPDLPLNDVVPDPVIDSTLFLASDAGVYFTTDLGTNWQPLGSGMPVLVCNDLKFHNPTRTLLVGTYGRGMYKFDLNTISALNPQFENNHLSISVLQNPVNENSAIQFSISKSEPVVISVFDLQGKKVFTLNYPSAKAGQTKIKWNELSNGKDLQAGSYVINLATKNEQASARFVFLNQ